MTTAITTHSPADVSFQQMERMAQAVAKSGLFGAKQPEQALALMMLAQSEGLHPATAARDYHIIQGRPSLKADTMLARFQQAGGKVEWNSYTDTNVTGTFSHPQAGSVVIEWTIDRAHKAGLTGKDTWKSYARAMLRARCISEGVRTCYPGVAIGVYTPEEIESLDPVVLDAPVSRVEAAIQQASNSATMLTDEEIDEHVIAMRESEDIANLTAMFASAWKHASDAKDSVAREKFKRVYDARKAELSQGGAL